MKVTECVTRNPVKPACISGAKLHMCREEATGTVPKQAEMGEETALKDRAALDEISVCCDFNGVDFSNYTQLGGRQLKH